MVSYRNIVSQLSIVILLMLTYMYSPAAIGSVQAAEIIYLDKPKLQTDMRGLYLEALLEKILDVTKEEYGEAEIRYSKTVMGRDRSLIALQEGESLHVMAAHPKPDWDEKAICVQFPIRRGLLSYRVYLIKEESQPYLSKITTLAELKKISTGSRAQWSITKAFQEGGFNVVFGDTYDGLFKMLNIGRFMTFSRGVNEIFGELEVYKKKFPDFVIEKDLLLYVYIPTYYYVSPRKPLLAERIEKGLYALYESEEFEKVFQKYHGEILEKLKLSERRVFRIANPSISGQRYKEDENYLYLPN